MKKHVFTGVFIPAKIWLSKDINPQKKMILAEIKALSEDSGWCYASNGHFAEWLGTEPKNASKYINQLHDEGLIEVTYMDLKTFQGRKMRVNLEWYHGENAPSTVSGTPSTVSGPPSTVSGTEIQSKYNTKEEEEESAQGGTQNLQPSEQKEKINPPVAPPPPDKKESEFTLFDIDRAAADMTTDFRCVERFAREFKCSIETATEKHPKAVLEFVEDQKTVGTIYHADRQFRSHYFSWLPKRAAAKLAEKRKQQEQNTNTTATTNQYKRLTTDETFIPRNIPVYR